MCEQLYLTDDRLLFDKIRGGNAKAFEYAFRKFSPRLEAFAQKYTNDTNEAEDIVQDVFLNYGKEGSCWITSRWPLFFS